jgi:hypothetical protein
MDIQWGAAALLAALAILATTTRMALKDTTPQDRASVLRAIAELVRELHP